MVMHSKKMKPIENSFFKNCLVINNESNIKYDDKKCCVILTNCTVKIDDYNVITIDEDGCLHIDNSVIIIKPIKPGVDKRTASAEEIAPIISDDDSDDGADCHFDTIP